MEISVAYIISQVLTIITYILLALTYYAKNRNRVLIISFLSLITNGLAYAFLSAWTGLAMCFVAIIRNIICIVDERKNSKSDKMNKKDIIILIVLYIIIVTLSVFTYDGFFSLLSVFATVLYTYSVFQKKTEIYKLLGIPIGILMILYNIYVKSIFGTILESILFICSITGYILDIRKKKN